MRRRIGSVVTRIFAAAVAMSGAQTVSCSHSLAQSREQGSVYIYIYIMYMYMQYIFICILHKDYVPLVPAKHQ